MRKKGNNIPYSQQSPSKKYVQNMFDDLADNYDNLNKSMSWGVDKTWRKCAINVLKKENGIYSILDVATGTGDLSILAEKIISPSKIVGVDISNKMLEVAKRKVEKLNKSEKISFMNADCAELPFKNDSFDAVISAFALRNFENLEKCLSEMYRVLRPKRKIVIIDLCNPVKAPMKQLFWCYKKLIMPIIGHFTTHVDSSYKYLPHSMSIIPQGDEMCEIFTSAGFSNMKYKRLKFQMCILYSGIK